MAIAIEDTRSLQVGRGGFLRYGQNGPPQITDPDGAVVKSGDRKGEPLRIPYGSPSNFGKLIESTFNLQKWAERRVALGFGITAAAGDYTLLADAHALTQMDEDSDEYKEFADRLVVRAKDAAKAMLAADRGTHTHALAEDHDEGRDWVARAEAGEDLGLYKEVQASLVQAWLDMLERDGLEILAAEAACVDDTWHLAGTLDRIARCTRDLRFAKADGAIVTIPAGTVLVLDVKTGKRKTNSRGVVQYWHGYALQVASYAQSRPYDVDTETRGDWPWPISQDHALIAHLDVLGALDGNPSCTLVYVDLAAARASGGQCVLDAKAWGKRDDLFSVAQADEIAAPSDPTAEVEQPAAEVGAATSAAPSPTDQGADTWDANSPTTSPSSATRTCGSPSPTPPNFSSRHGDRATTSPTRPTSESSPGAACTDLTPAEQHALVRTTPDEGGDADDAAMALLSERYAALPRVERAWMNALQVEAQQSLVPFHTKVANGGKCTVRRFSIVLGLLHLAPNSDTEVLRSILATIIGDVALFPSVKPGHALGSLTAEEAKVFARRAEMFVSTAVPGHVDDSGVLRLTFDDGAAAA